MNAETFKKAAEILETRNYIIGFDTKKHMIEMLADFDENGQIKFDDDIHWTIYVGKTCYTDEEITKSLLKKADYIEQSWGDGWTIYIGRNCSEGVLDAAFEASIGWGLNAAAEFGELTNTQLDALELMAIELEAAASNREWNNANEAEDADLSEEAEVESEKIAEDLMAEIEAKQAEDARRAEQAGRDVAAKIEANREDAEHAAELENVIAANITKIEESKAEGEPAIEDDDLNPRRSKAEIQMNWRRRGGTLKSWDGETWTFREQVRWSASKFVQLIDSEGAGEYWCSKKLPSADREHFLRMMKLEMAQIRRMSAL